MALIVGLVTFLSNFVFAAGNRSVDFFGAPAFGGHGGSFYSASLVDFDRDGVLDWVTSSHDTVFVYYGSGGGLFLQQPVALYTFTGHTFPVTSDFNGDGSPDIALRRHNPQTLLQSIAVYFSGPGRTFTSPVYTDLPDLPLYLFPFDLDLDGYTDILGTSPGIGSSSVAFFKGNGSGGFLPGVDIATMTGSPSDIAVGDLDNDGDMDVAYTDSGVSGFRVIRNLGNTTFGAPVTVDTIPFGFQSLEIGDVNHDGVNDVSASQATASDPVVATWLGSDAFSFSHAGDITLGVQQQAYLQQIVDIDLDGNMDLTFSASNRSIIRWGQGNGQFAQQTISYEGGRGDLRVKDINSDGLPDLVATQAITWGGMGSGTFVTILNRGNRLFRTAPTIETGSGEQDIVAGNLNGDSFEDFVVMNRGSGNEPGEVRVFFQSPSSAFVEHGSGKGHQFGLQGIDGRAAVLGNFAGTTSNDIIVVGRGVNGTPQNSMLLTNLNNNTFSVTLLSIGSADIYDVEAADLNSDGKLDLVTAAEQVGLQFSFGNGNGTFAPPVLYQPAINAGRAAIADLNDDGKPDIAVQNYANNKIAVLINSGSGTFGPPILADACSGLTELKLARIDLGQSVDIVAACGTGLGIYRGNGDGTFAPAQINPITQGPIQRLTLGDLNGDGHLDVSAIAGRNSLVAMLNNGGGAFTEDSIWSVGADAVAVASANFDNNSKSDVLVGFTDSDHGFVKLFYNLSPDSVPNPKAPFDFDGDGKTDVGIYRPVGGEWWWRRSSDGVVPALQFGNSTDVIAPGDFTGDGKLDHAFFRPSDGFWHFLRSEDFTYYAFPFGVAGDVPVTGDYDGDGKADAAVFRGGTWYVARSSGGTTITGFGVAGDVPVTADYDGDGKDDMGIYRPNGSGGGEWWINRSTAGLLAMQFGAATDKTVPGDYTGDGKADIAFWRPSTGEWYIVRSEDSSYYAFPFGINGDIPAPGDYDGDGKMDPAIFRNGTWYIGGSTSGTQIFGLGVTGDRPIPNSFVR